MVLSPHVFLLGLIFADDAFEAPSLQRADQLGKLDIGPGQNQLILPLKESKYDDYIFCQTEKRNGVLQSSPRLRLPAGTMAAWLRIVGEILGLLQVASGYCLRYAGGKVLNESGMFIGLPLLLPYSSVDPNLRSRPCQ